MMNQFFVNIILFSVIFYDIKTRLQIVIAGIYILYIFFKERNFTFSKNVLIFLGYILIISLLKINIYDYKINKMIQQYFVISLLTVAYYSLFKKNNFYYLWNRYIFFSKITAILGLLQLIVYYLFQINFLNTPYNYWGLGYGYSLGERIIQISSFSGEPGSFSQVIMPAVIFSFEKLLLLKKIKLSDVLLIIAYFGSRTTIALVGVLIYIIIKVILTVKNKKKIIGLGIINIILINILSYYYNNNNMVKLKMQETIKVLRNFNTYDLNKVNISTFALISNFKAAILSKHNIFGNGLGTAEEVYYRYFPNKNYIVYGLNAEDASSIGIRIFSEFGIVGLLLILGIIFFNFRYNYKKRYLSSISIACTVGVLSYFLKGGSYYTFGTILFFIFIIYLKKEWEKIDVKFKN